MPFGSPAGESVAVSPRAGDPPRDMAKAQLNTGETLFGVNDLFIGPKSHVSARYKVEFGDRSEEQSSSGIIVSTGLGSTGWLRSVLTGAAGIASSISAHQLRIDPDRRVPWDADYLFFSVREPWPSKTSSAGITFGKVMPGRPLRIMSQMPEHGVIFSDGIEADFVAFRSGLEATISVAEKQGHLVGRR